MTDHSGNGKDGTLVAAPPSANEMQGPPEQPSEAKPVRHRRPFFMRLSRFLSSLSVRSKIAGMLLLVLCTAVLSLGLYTFTRQNSLLRSEMRSRAETLVQQLASAGKEGLLTKQELPVVSTISDIQNRVDVVYALVLDDEGRVFAHSDFSKKNAVLTGPVDRAAMKADGLLFQEVDLIGDPVLDAAVPVLLKSKNLRIGVARIGLSQKALNEQISAQLRTYLWIALGFICGGLVISFLVARMLTKPLDSLEEGIQIVAKGDLRKLVQVRSNDEIGRLTNAFNQMILSLREKLLMEKYLSQTTVLSIKEHRDVSQLKLGGERKYVTALFSDARGFTSLSEKMTPEEVVSLMNVYLNLQTTVIHQFGGIVDKFVGDEVMAIFEGKGMEVNAVRAAVEIQHYCEALNAARAAAGEQTVSVGIGLNSGDVVMGNMGSEDHMDYTVIGDSINVAARLCGVAQPGQVLISKSTADETGDETTRNELPAVRLKGKDQPISIAEIVSVKGGSRRYMRKETDIPVSYSLEGFSDELNSAMVKNIGPAGCLLQTEVPIAIGSKLNITFNIYALGTVTVHAAVYHARKIERQYYIGLCFENLQQEIRHKIVQWIHQVNSGIGEGLFL
ncbi:MAG: HAMP domain-containing protein [Nitrospirota bacterium]|nr:HAMP domain-containing protein [Nitrospirota bacterium]